jgi:hypothetical protein
VDLTQVICPEFVEWLVPSDKEENMRSRTWMKAVGVSARGKREVLFCWDVADAEGLQATQEREQAAR